MNQNRLLINKNNEPVNIFWFRRDLRLEDNRGLYHALTANLPVLPLFIFDKDILDRLSDKADKRVEFIHNAVEELNDELGKYGSFLLTIYGKPYDVFRKLIKEHWINAVYTNNDYEPYAKKRDDAIAKLLGSNEIKFLTYKDQVIFEKDEILNRSGSPYTIFTPYYNAWTSRLQEEDYRSFSARKNNFIKTKKFRLPLLKEFGFVKTGITFPSKTIRKKIIKEYHMKRDYPFIAGTSRLSVHLRFGTISIRKLVRSALKLNPVFLKELVWREFFMNILYHFPYAAEGSFRKEYDRIIWRNNEDEFDAWCGGRTGYPMVDAGMRELNETGYMHNRVRMITASFLVKHLLIDWRWGEQYFAEKLIDYELSSNNGNWQWAAGTGCDATPYFRVFNPMLQQAKFDPDMKYAKKWIPEFGTPLYPKPIVDHKFARERAIKAFKAALNN